MQLRRMTSLLAPLCGALLAVGCDVGPDDDPADDGDLESIEAGCTAASAHRAISEHWFEALYDQDHDGNRFEATSPARLSFGTWRGGYDSAFAEYTLSGDVTRGKYYFREFDACD